MNFNMSSPQKRTRRFIAGHGRRPSESDLPLHLALAYLLVRAHPLGSDGVPINIYSISLTGSILKLVAREILEVSSASGDAPKELTEASKVEPSASTFDLLRRDVEVMVKSECNTIARLNDKVRRRGQVICQDRANAENFENWMNSFVSRQCSLC